MDLGRELYIPWQILEGQHLYRDIPYPSGLFSPHFNALIMALFGVSLHALIITNTIFVACIAYLIFWITSRASVLCLGMLAACTFIIIFAFSANNFVNCFNFITPYVHELPHGFLLSLLSITLLEVGIDRQQNRKIACAGVAVGLAFLTRLEIALSLLAALSAWWWCTFHHDTYSPACKRLLCIFLMSTILTIAISAILLHQHTPEINIWRSLFASFFMVFTTSIASSPYFRSLAGWNIPNEAISRQVFATAIFLFFLLQCYACAHMTRLRSKVSVFFFGMLGSLLALLLIYIGTTPLFSGGILLVSTFGIFVITVIRIYSSPSINRSLRISITATMFAGIMLTKILLLPNTNFYGFSHGLVAYILLVVTILFVLPKLVLRKLGLQPSQVFTCILATLLLADVGAEGLIDQRKINPALLRIGSENDEFFVINNQRNTPYQEFLREAPQLIPPFSTMAVLPEGIMLNYLLRIPSTTHNTHYTVSEYIMFGKENIEGDLQHKPPDFVVLAHKDTPEFGYPLYGKMPEYGAEIMGWMQKNYEQIALFGKQPLEKMQQEGIALWKRKK